MKKIINFILVISDKNVIKAAVRYIYMLVELIMLIAIIALFVKGNWIAGVILLPVMALIWILEKILNYFWK